VVVLLVSVRAAAEPAPEGNALVRGGATYRHLFDIPVYGAEAGLAIGSFDASGGTYFLLHGLYGRTQAGLGVGQLGAGFRGEARLSRVSLGGQLSFGPLWVARATKSGALSSWGIEGTLVLGCDLFGDERGALALELELAVDAVGGRDATVFWGPGLALSYRFDG
jgi:hypothetical protein